MKTVLIACGVVGLGTLVSLAAEDNRLQTDLMGQAMYSHYNFTDVENPYDGLDAYLVLKGAYWLDASSRQVAPYVEVIPTYASEDAFWWQRHVQANVGLQAYVTGVDGPALLRGLRLFGFAAGRYYYDEPSDGDAEDTDVQAGADYYFDNIPGTKSIWASAVFANAGYRQTAFALEDYEAFTVFGNVKTGPKLTLNSMILFPYGVADWSYSPTYDERWWENYVRVGGGLAWYPFCNSKGSDSGWWGASGGRRLNVFVEGLSQVADLGDTPPDSVEDTDIRAGVAFSTSGFYREATTADR